MEGNNMLESHVNGTDLDTILTSSGEQEVSQKSRRLLEPYERHRAHDLRAECYRRGIRPIKKGPHANDNKGGYISLLREYDGVPSSKSQKDQMHVDSSEKQKSGEQVSPRRSGNGAREAVAKKRKLPTNQSAMDIYEVGVTGATPAHILPVLPVQYAAAARAAVAASASSGNPTSASDLEILSGIANTYNQGALAYPGYRFQIERALSEKERDMRYLKEVLGVIHDLRDQYRKTKEEKGKEEVLAEIEDDIEFFQALKRTRKEQMKAAMTATETPNSTE